MHEDSWNSGVGLFGAVGFEHSRIEYTIPGSNSDPPGSKYLTVMYLRGT